MFDADLAAARGASYLALLLVAGLPLYSLAMGERCLSGAMRRILLGLAAAALVTSLWWVWASVAAMAGLPLGAVDFATVQAVLAATPLGMVLETRAMALVLLVLGLFGLPGRYRLPVAALCGGAALITASWTGHAGAGEGATGMMRRLIDAAHLLAAATWLGALAALLGGQFGGQLGGASSDVQMRRLRGFATIGSVIVAVLAITGTVSALAILGLPVPEGALESGWAALLAAKLVLFAAMLGLAASNRWRLVPAMEAGEPGAGRRLCVSLLLEILAGGLIVALVAVLGTLAPAGG
ncbi:copper homeostasis membrane protein CopD [Novosphingobium naphthalenivorans]|uniref:copper homeostasis membrane protein CopD n=1 Tax=Novosphingobium naphthalenivorans TaxID=273168 RepID=UPI00082CCBC2|nr:copper homeostasis membrane protein CopD [Novosphingobium naphthalenivorans]